MSNSHCQNSDQI